MGEYEIHLAGPIGPVAASCLPGFTASTVPPVTVLTGAVTCPDDLLGVLSLLRAHGLVPIDIRIDPHHDKQEPTSPDDFSAADRG